MFESKYSTFISPEENILSKNAWRYNDVSIFGKLYETCTSWARCITSIYWYTNWNKTKWYCGFIFEHYLKFVLDERFFTWYQQISRKSWANRCCDATRLLLSRSKGKIHFINRKSVSFWKWDCQQWKNDLNMSTMFVYIGQLVILWELYYFW